MKTKRRLLKKVPLWGYSSRDKAPEGYEPKPWLAAATTAAPFDRIRASCERKPRRCWSATAPAMEYMSAAAVTVTADTQEEGEVGEGGV